MESTHSIASQELIGVVRGVRNRYRAKLALRGAAIVIAGTWVTLALATYAANTLKYSDGALLTARIVSALVALGLIAWFLVRPLLLANHDHFSILEELANPEGALCRALAEMASLAPAE